jgi:hypothetical protein
MLSGEIEAAAGDRTRLRLNFRWLGDRYGQLISLITSGGVTHALLESMEGSDNDDWPFSPPLQSLSIQTPAGKCTAALLVGAAGKSYWSASIEAADNGPALVFDIACRHGERPGWLGSRYRRLTDVAKLTVVSTDEIVEDGDTLTIQPATPLDSAGTTRWRFRLEPAPQRSAP